MNAYDVIVSIPSGICTVPEIADGYLTKTNPSFDRRHPSFVE